MEGLVCEDWKRRLRSDEGRAGEKGTAGVGGPGRAGQGKEGKRHLRIGVLTVVATVHS
jgi:hypothetical protein